MQWLVNFGVVGSIKTSIPKLQKPVIAYAYAPIVKFPVYTIVWKPQRANTEKRIILQQHLDLMLK